MSETERKDFEELAGLEDLAEKKTRIYSRLLTDIDLASDMERLSAKHAKRKEALLVLAGWKEKKATNADENGGE